MANRTTSSTCCLTLPLKLERWQEDRLSKRFEIARQIYNAMVCAELKKLHRLERSTEYRENQAQLAQMFQNHETGSKAYKQAAKKRTDLLKQAGLTEYGFKSDIKKYYKHFSDNIGSHVAVHCIAAQVWSAFEKKLFHGAKKVHYKKIGEVHSLKGYSQKKSGGTEIVFRGDYIEWKGLKLTLKTDENNEYETRMLEYRVKYVRLVREKGRYKDRWYAQLSLEGTPVVKYNPATGEPIHPVGSGSVGIDIGPQTIAYAAPKEVDLLELADKVRNIEHQKRLLQRKMDRSIRAMNPENYAENGTIRRGVKLTHNKSKHYLALQRELAYLHHQQAATRKRQHTELANHLLSLGNQFFVEDMQWSSLAHRAKETAVSEKTGKYKKKKRFGKSIANKAPAMLISILKQKCTTLGLPGVVEVPTIVRASQYNHLSQTYQKKTLSQRWNEMPDGRRIQRDIYSAFLLQHTNQQLNGFYQAELEQEYDSFIHLHNAVIDSLSRKSKTLSSMGISKKVS